MNFLCFSNPVVVVCRFFVVLLNDHLHVIGRQPSGWTHIVGNYIGPSDGLRLFMDGEEVASDTNNLAGSRSAGDGRIVVGRRFTARHEHYASAHIDELFFFNQTLTRQEITTLAAANQF